jgi:hypothetical protein
VYQQFIHTKSEPSATCGWVRAYVESVESVERAEAQPRALETHAVTWERGPGPEGCTADVLQNLEKCDAFRASNAFTPTIKRWNGHP